jgi:flagellar FliL protein
MARKRKKAGEEGAESAEGDKGGKGKKGNLVPAVVIAIGLIVGGKMMGGGGGAAPAASAVATTTTLVAGPVVKIDPITLNMSDGRFLRVGLGFQLSADAATAAHTAKPDTTDAAGTYAKALDLAIGVLGGQNYQELVSPAGREAAKKELLKELKVAYPHEIEDVYFTEFVLQ